MSSLHKIVCLGGTGQMVLHYYVQLYLLGLIKQPFDAVVIDTDEFNDSILRVQRLLKNLQYGSSPEQGLGVELPTIETYRVTGFHAGSARERLTQRSDGDAQPHPVRAFFDHETLAQDLKEGLFARPALSSVVSLGAVSQQALKAPNKATVVVVGSMIGGTGGGLIAPVIDAIHWNARQANANVSIRAVLFGTYFAPDPGRLGGNELRFYSNEILVLRAIREALGGSQLDRFVIVRRTGGGHERRPDLEKKAEHLPWPEPGDPRGVDHPFWAGVQALEYLLKDTTTQQFVNFQQRESLDFVPPVALDKALEQLTNSVHGVGALVERAVVTRMAHEPWLSTIWRDDLVRLFTHFWSTAIRTAGSADRVTEFPRQVQIELQSMWSGRKDAPGLRQLFPQVPSSRHVRPSALTRVPWPRGHAVSRSNELFRNTETAARRAAATLVFWGLREAN